MHVRVHVFIFVAGMCTWKHASTKKTSENTCAYTTDTLIELYMRLFIDPG